MRRGGGTPPGGRLRRERVEVIDRSGRTGLSHAPGGRIRRLRAVDACAGPVGGARQAFGTTATRVGALVLAMFASVVIARSLQPAGRGSYHLIVTTAATAISLGHLSVEQAQTTLWTDARNRRAVAENSLPLAMAVGGVVTAVMLALIAVAGRTVNLQRPGLVALALLGVPFGIATLYTTNVTVLNARMRVANRAVLAGALLQCGSLIALGAAGRLSAASVIAVWVLATMAPCCVIVAAGRFKPRRLDTSLAWRTVLTGLSYHAGPASMYLLLRADVFILAAQCSTTLVGLYALAVSVSEMSRFATDSISQVALARQIGNEPVESARVTVRTTRITTLAGLASAVALALAAPLAIPFAYGRSFSGSVPLVLILLPGAFALGAVKPVSGFLLRQHSARYLIVPSLTALALNIALNVVLIPVAGVAGCCVASTVGYVAMALLQARMFACVSGISARSLLPRRADIGTIGRQLNAVLRFG